MGNLWNRSQCSGEPVGLKWYFESLHMTQSGTIENSDHCECFLCSSLYALFLMTNGSLSSVIGLSYKLTTL